MSLVKFDLLRAGHQGMIYMDFPALKDWEIKAHQHLNSWFLPQDTDIAISIRDFDVNFSADLVVNNRGMLDPVVYAVDIEFGESAVNVDNPKIENFIHQFIILSINIIEQSSFFMG
mmetsp:Transcript_12780/g.21606  ORF Transcript_12780/g.21606 Transcript_12780/m.21606 type:complete len:116 (-) Transcript_12780:1001-1348(-)